ncbi:TetR/AcrR family transcriptional regulator [Rhodococcus sp. NPDC058521]|uniref:TetR/AcrR family transcriptional regulator n=1 Tax=Rhodococcus sp. NPDC058521 TaxID=3346536 RepID=UPI003651D1C8
MPGHDIPEPLRRLWRLPEQASRLGRPSSLDTDVVVQAAVRLADRDGLGAATLPRVAADLGVTAMSLYRHVGSKLELLDLMVDFASTTPSAPTEDRGWREGLTVWADELWDLYRSRPWIVRVPVHGAPTGPNQLAWLERALTVIADTDLDWAEKVGYVMLLSGYVRQSILLTQDLSEGRDDAEQQAESERRYGLAMRDLVDSRRFPQLSDMFDSDVFDGPSVPTETTARNDFHGGLETILDGIAARLDG